MIMFPLPFIMQSSKIQFTKGISCREEYYFSIYSPGKIRRSLTPLLKSYNTPRPHLAA